MMKKTGVRVPMEQVPEALLDGKRTFSGADMEAILTRAKFRAIAEVKGREKPKVNGDILDAVVSDFIPPTYPMAIELQNLAAVLECTSEGMLPEHFRTMERENIVRRVEELKRLVR
jgi:hypothetical protein